MWIADLSLVEPDGKEAAGAVIEALGPALAKPLVDLLERDPSRARPVTQVLTQHAALLAPAVVPLLERRSPAVLRTLLRVVAAAGPGHEEIVATYISSGDEQTAREALRTLARIGTTKAATLVAGEIERQRGPLGAAAEETLWHFSLPEAQRQTRDLLGRRDFTASHPQACERLLDRAARAGADLRSVLEVLAPMRFRVWNPALARMARKAHAMLKAPVTK